MGDLVIVRRSNGVLRFGEIIAETAAPLQGCFEVALAMLLPERAKPPPQRHNRADGSLLPAHQLLSAGSGSAASFRRAP